MDHMGETAILTTPIWTENFFRGFPIHTLVGADKDDAYEEMLSPRFVVEACRFLTAFSAEHIVQNPPTSSG